MNAALTTTDNSLLDTSASLVDTGGQLGTITSSLQNGDDVNFTGFGKFSVNERGPRQGVNPRTGERITIPGGKVPKFSAGAGLKNAVKG